MRSVPRLWGSLPYRPPGVHPPHARIGHLDIVVTLHLITTVQSTIGQFGANFKITEYLPDCPEKLYTHRRYYSEKKYTCFESPFTGIQKLEPAGKNTYKHV